MIKIFGKRIAEMRDIEDAKKEVYENMNKEVYKNMLKHFEQVDGIFEIVGNRLEGIEKYLSAFADEVFMHLPAKKSNVSPDYHHKRVAKALESKPVEQEAGQSEQGV